MPQLSNCPSYIVFLTAVFVIVLEFAHCSHGRGERVLSMSSTEANRVIPRSRHVQWADLEGEEVDVSRPARNAKHVAPNEDGGDHEVPREHHEVLAANASVRKMLRRTASRRPDLPVFARPSREARILQLRASVDELCSHDLDLMETEEQRHLTYYLLTTFKSLVRTSSLWDPRGNRVSDEAFLILSLRDEALHELGPGLCEAETLFEKTRFREAYEKICAMRSWVDSKKDQQVKSSWSNTSAISTSASCVPTSVPGLNAFLCSYGLGKYSENAQLWCQDMGAAFLSEVVENLSDFVDSMGLTDEERARLNGVVRKA